MKKLKLLLVSAPGLDLEDFNRDHNKIRGYGLYPPIQLTILAGSVLKKVDDSEIEILDLEFEIRKYFSDNIDSTVSPANFMEKTIVNKLNKFQPDVVGISVVFSPAHTNTLTIADIVKKTNSKTVVLSGGNHATFAYETILTKCPSMDYVFLYEADSTLPLFLNYLKGEKKFEDLRGLAWLDKETNKTKLSLYAPMINELDEVPIPKWDLVPLKEYYKYGRIGAIQRYGNENLPSYTIQTVRGCVASCTFCSVRSFYGKGVRAFSAKRVLEEMDYLYNDLGITQLEILDDDFTFDKERTLEICNGLIKRNYNLTWNLLNGIRLSTLHDEVLSAMVAAKCRGFSVGVESGNDKTLAIVKKPLSIKMLYRKAELIQQYPELYVTGNYMVGFPFEDEEQMMNTYKVANDIGFDWSVFTVFRPLAGTPLFQKLDKKGKEDSIENQKDYNEGFAFARKYKNEIEKQMESTLQHAVEPSSKLNHSKDLNKSTDIEDLQYVKNLEINFLNNKNLIGLNYEKNMENKKGMYQVKIDKKINLDRAIKDFEGVVNYIEKNHAIGHYCLAKAYKYKNDKNQYFHHLNKVSDILNDPRYFKWNEYFNKLLPEDKIKILKNKNFEHQRLSI